MSSKKSGYDQEEIRSMAVSLVGALTIGLQPEKQREDYGINYDNQVTQIRFFFHRHVLLGVILI